MGRASLVINKDLLSKSVLDCESAKEYSNRSLLFKDVASTYGTYIGKSVSTTWILQRIQELGIELRTPKGRIGRVQGQAPASGERRTRAEKLATDPKAVKSLSLLKKDVLREKQGKYLPLFKKVEQGSLKAAIQLKCLDCTNYQANEIRHCPCNACVLWNFRPFKNQGEEEIEIETIDNEQIETKI